MLEHTCAWEGRSYIKYETAPDFRRKTGIGRCMARKGVVGEEEAEEGGRVTCCDIRDFIVVRSEREGGWYHILAPECRGHSQMRGVGLTGR